jgi:hypothetical protein
MFRYDTPLDNRKPFYGNHRTGFGYAVRYTSDAATDARVNAGTRSVAKFHDRSVTVFTGPAQDSENAWLTQGMLTGGGMIADFAGEEPAPMYTAAWSPPDGPNVPLVASVIMKRFPARKDNGSYPWQIGPARFYHLIMSPMSPTEIDTAVLANLPA